MLRGFAAVQLWLLWLLLLLLLLLCKQELRAPHAADRRGAERPRACTAGRGSGGCGHVFERLQIEFDAQQRGVVLQQTNEFGKRTFCVVRVTQIQRCTTTRRAHRTTPDHIAFRR